MTAQIEEILLYENKKHCTHFDGIYSFLKKNKGLEEPFSESSNCYRGYEGQWELKDKKLYLKKLKVYLKSGKTADMSLYFPGSKEVFAAWFSGEIDLPAGKETMYSHSTGPMYERYHVLKFKKGVLTKKFEKDGFF
jgi:hypothetical protein